MANKQFKTYCRIMDYLEAVDSELAQICRGLCVDMSLGSLKGKSGITFLMPVDKTFRAKLEKLAYSDKTEDASKASDMLNALIIKDVFKTPSDWMAKRDDIPNSLYPSQHIEVDSAAAKEVIFKSGAKATLDLDFKDSSRKQNLVVWKLTGEIPVTTDKPAKHKYGKIKGKMGGYVPTVEQTRSKRFQIALAVENTYVLSQLQSHCGIGRAKDVYLETVLSLVSFLMQKDQTTLHERVLPLISLDRIDFYFLVEPHRATGEYLINDSYIAEWWDNRHTFNAGPAVISQIEQHLNTAAGAAVYTDRGKLLENIAAARQNIMKTLDAQPRNSINEIEKYYIQLESGNTIGGAGPVYPDSLAGFYLANKGLKMLQDELRYVTFGMFKMLESRAFDLGFYHELVNLIGECLAMPTDTDRARSQKLLNKTTLKYMIAPTEKVQEIKIFLNSTMFLYIPLTSAECKSLKTKYSVTRPDPANITLWNLHELIYSRHKRLLAGDDKTANAGLIEMLKGLNIDTLDPALKEEIRKKFGV